MKLKWTIVDPHSGLKEDAPANAAGFGNIHGIGVGPHGEPGIKKKKKKNDESVLMTRDGAKFDARAVGYGGYMYYKDTQQRIMTLKENNAKLEVAEQMANETINTMMEDRERMAELNKGLQKQLQSAERYGDQLRNTLQKHNLTHLANKRPSYIEKKMQNATNRLWDCLADITNPNGVFVDAGTESGNCNKNSKNTGSNSSKAKTSPAK